MLPVTHAPRPHPHRSRPGRLAGLATGLASFLLVAGCAGLHPGAAVVVGDEVITDDRVDLASRALCTYFEPQVEQPVPLVEVRRTAAVLLGLRSAVEQLAERHGVTPGSDYNREVARLEELAEQLPEGEREAFLEAQGAQVYVPLTLAEVGGAVLESEGHPAGAEAGLGERTEAGVRALLEFVEEEQVEFAPSLGLGVEVPEIPAGASLQDTSALVGRIFVPVDSSASVPVTEVAKGAAATAAGQAPAVQLPTGQRCG